jgi:hypothetical protein
MHCVFSYVLALHVEFVKVRFVIEVTAGRSTAGGVLKNDVARGSCVTSPQKKSTNSSQICEAS